MTEQYRLVITGLQDEWDVDDAAQAMAAMTKSDVAKVKLLIERAPVAFGQAMPLEKARRYQGHLHKAGVTLDVRRLETKTAPGAIAGIPEQPSAQLPQTPAVMEPPPANPFLVGLESPPPALTPARQAATSDQAGLSLVPTDEKRVPGMMACPRCEHEQSEKNEECEGCGIIFAKFRARHEETLAPMPGIKFGAEHDEAGNEPLAPDVLNMLKNTYLLLSATLLFSALMSWVGLKSEPGSSIVYLIGAFALLGFTYWARDSVLGLVGVFAFTGWVGFWTGPVVNHYLSLENGGQLVAMSAMLTALVFFSLSGYVLMTKKNFSFMGGFLFMGLIVIIVGNVIGAVFDIANAHIAMSCISIVVFSGYILYDTSEIVHRGETNYIMATIDLYLDIINLFFSLLRITSYLEGDD